MQFLSPQEFYYLQVRQPKPTREVFDDGLGGPVRFAEVSTLIPIYQQIKGIKKLPVDSAGNGHVYLEPEFRGFVWGLLGGDDIPKDMQPETFKPNGHDLGEKTYVRAADRAHQYRMGFRIAREVRQLPLTRGEKETNEDDAVREKLASRDANKKE